MIFGFFFVIIIIIIIITLKSFKTTFKAIMFNSNPRRLKPCKSGPTIGLSQWYILTLLGVGKNEESLIRLKHIE